MARTSTPGAASAKKMKLVKKKAAGKNRRVAPPAQSRIDKAMAELDKRVKTKEARISKLIDDVQKRARAQVDEDARLLRLTEERDRQRAVAEMINVERQAIQNERTAAERDLKVAIKDWGAIHKKLPHLLFKRAKTIVRKVDSRITKAKKALETAQAEADRANERANQARDAVAKAEARRREQQLALQRVANEIRSARGRLASILAQVKVFDETDTESIVAVAREVDEAIVALKKLKAANDETLMRSLLDTDPLDESVAWRDNASGEADQANARLAQARQMYSDLVQKRSNEIRTRLLKHKNR